MTDKKINQHHLRLQQSLHVVSRCHAARHELAHHVLHVWVRQHGSGHVHQRRVAQQRVQVHPTRPAHHPRRKGRTGSGGSGRLLLGQVQVRLVALVVRLQLEGLLEALDGLLVAVHARVGQPHAPVCLAVFGVHVDGALAVLNRRVVVVQLAVGGGAVAVEHLVRRVELNSSERFILTIKLQCCMFADADGETVGHTRSIRKI